MVVPTRTDDAHYAILASNLVTFLLFGFTPFFKKKFILSFWDKVEYDKSSQVRL